MEVAEASIRFPGATEDIDLGDLTVRSIGVFLHRPEGGIDGECIAASLDEGDGIGIVNCRIDDVDLQRSP